MLKYFCLAVLVVTVEATKILDPIYNWGYMSPYGYLPTIWYKHRSGQNCNGNFQSPINIDDQTAEHDPKLKALIFSKTNLDHKNYQIWKVSVQAFKRKLNFSIL